MRTIIEHINESVVQSSARTIYNITFGNDKFNNMADRFKKLDEVFDYAHLFTDIINIKNIISDLKSIVRQSPDYNESDRKYIIKNIGRMTNGKFPKQ